MNIARIGEPLNVHWVNRLPAAGRRTRYGNVNPCRPAPRGSVVSYSVDPDATETALDDLPQFDLDYLVDDIQEPSKVMILPDWDNDSGLSRWLTMDFEHSVSLEDLR